jgi:type II secretory pathway component PulF
VAIVFFSLFQIYLALSVVPRFAGIYRDMLGNHPLPSATIFVLHDPWVLVGLALLCLLAASLLAASNISRGWLIAILVLLLLQIAVTLIALFMPMFGDIIRTR